MLWARFLLRIFTHLTLCLLTQPPSKVQARLQHPVKTFPVRPEFHRAIIRWNVNDGLGNPRLVAASAGNQISSRLLSMKCATALLELPATGSLIPAGTSVAAIVISDLVQLLLMRVVYHILLPQNMDICPQRHPVMGPNTASSEQLC